MLRQSRIHHIGLLCEFWHAQQYKCTNAKWDANKVFEAFHLYQSIFKMQNECSFLEKYMGSVLMNHYGDVY